MSSSNSQKKSTSDIIPLVWFQDHEEKPCYCKNCKDVCVYQIPIGFPLSRWECEICLNVGFITDKIPRRFK